MSSNLLPIVKSQHKILIHRPFSSSHRSYNAVHLSTKDHHVLDETPQRSSASYDSAIAASCRSGHVSESCALLSRMMALNLRPTRFTFVPILSSQPLDFSCGTHLHSLLIKTGLVHSDPYSATALMGHYATHRGFEEAVKLFDEMPVRTLVTWNCIIAGFSQTGFVQDSFVLFRELLRSEFGPSESSFLSVLSGFQSSESSCLLEQVHGLVLRLSMGSYSGVSNALLYAYSNCFTDTVSERLFGDLSVKDLVTWNTIIAGFSRSAMPERALEFFFEMLSQGVSLNENTLASVLVACIALNSLVCGELIHAKAVKHNLSTSVYVGSSLVDFYAKSKRWEDAYAMFSEVPNKNVVTWNALITGYSNKDSSDMLVLVREMLCSGFRPNEFTFSSILRKASALDLWQLHSLVIRMGYENNDYVSTALISSYDAHDMTSDALACTSASDCSIHVAPSNVLAGIYNRMGRYKDTKELLLQLQYPDTISWNILIASCAKNGEYSEALQLFKRLQIAGNLLDNYMAVSLLSICSKINNHGLGSTLHGLIIKTNAGYSETFVSNVLMDMYAKCGSLKSCLRVFREMGERNLMSWTSLISGFGLHGRMNEALETFMQMKSDGYRPDKVAFLAALSACRHGGSVEHAMLLFENMKNVYGIEPEMDHYIILVDLLCGYGHLKEAEKMIYGMPFQPNPVIWRIFLRGCQTYHQFL
ncbi:uncharacterized protein A4U43_C05F17330 [Asparagus officinalis]|uniref:Pentacotripeptide-repeat region of PRORP domain-containing protein n=1 Tax=Asparagus officinalis TaxID=4686 RepID=A0A5P1ESC6_ASPOF|nr:pentatricopeptide repeat-containing protein At3g58590 [Asparagus officinalis]XP_020268537.1 pentatricopeptide repeat-containing protein At3g58590 [Asparagus officinalis]XP_020268538.1 pentatricopeptide repeat-containing protein At3g58590 [Asparagus officinalis]ONK68912.1 uncharacterized protein A4U43_C05F17330 [Asparagus officinalis]